MRFKSIYTILGLLFFAYLFTGSSAGRNDARAGAFGESTCSGCHSSAGTGSIVLTGAPTAYEPGTSYPLTLTLTDPAALVGGFQIVATDGTTATQVGTFSTLAGETRTNPINRLVQSTPKAFSGGSVSWTFNWTAPATAMATPNVQFYFAGNAANGNGGNGAGDMAYNGSTAMIPLPVELSQFDVIMMNDAEVKIAWQTRSETNSDYFEIQRSDDENIFESIGMIRAAGNSSSINDYSFMDETPLLNQQSYYRLKQVDLDGAVDYSPIQSIKVSSKDIAFDVFPNPVRQGESITIDISNSNNQKETIQLINMNGQVVWESIVINQEDSNHLLNIPELPFGQYLISVQSNNQILKTEKLMVIE